jgi:hypothetical protein
MLPDGEFFYKEPFDGLVVVHRREDGTIATNVPHHWDKYSNAPKFNINCFCPGTYNLALNILMDVGACKRQAFALHKAFAREYLIENLDDSRVLKRSRVKEWIEHQTKYLKLNLDEIIVY